MTMERKIPKAFCFSSKCNENYKYMAKSTAIPGKAVEASRSAIECPHCGHALVWKIENTYRRKEE